MQWDAVTQRILLVQPLKLAGETDSFNIFSTCSITDSTDFSLHCFRKFVQRTEVADLNREKEMYNF